MHNGPNTPGDSRSGWAADDGWSYDELSDQSDDKLLRLFLGYEQDDVDTLESLPDRSLLVFMLKDRGYTFDWDGEKMHVETESGERIESA